MYMRAALGYAVNLRVVVRNVSGLVEPVAQEHIERTEVTIDVVRTLLAAVKGAGIEPIVIFALATGCRRAEMAALRWSDVDLKTGRYAIRRPTKIVDKRIIYRTEDSQE